MAGEDERAELKRWLVTIGAIGLYFAGSHVPLPGVAYPDFSRLLASQRAPLGVSVFFLNVMPIVSALALAELARLVVSPLAHWVAKGPDQAALYLRIVRTLALIVAAGQAWGVVVGLRAAGVLYDTGWSSQLEIVATLVGATALLIWLAELINVKGVGDGLVLLYAAPLAARLPNEVANWWRFGAFLPGYVPFLLLALTLLSIAALIAVSRRRSPTGPLELWPLVLGGLLLLAIGPRIGDMFSVKWAAPTWTSLMGAVSVVAHVLLGAALFTLVAVRRAYVDKTSLNAMAALLLTVEFVIWLGAQLIAVLSHTQVTYEFGFDLILCVAAALSLLPAWRGGRALAPG